jgi:uncharacterized protein
MTTPHISLLKAIVFVAVNIVLLFATGPIVSFLAAITGSSGVSVWSYAGTFAALLLGATALALRMDGSDLGSLGFAPTRIRIREFTFGLALGVLLFTILAAVRGATVGVSWTFAGSNGAFAAAAGLGAAFLFLLPEDLLFRGYAFQRLVAAVGAWPGIVLSAVLFGIYHLLGSGMWGMGTFFQLAMPLCGGLVFGWAAIRTKGLALPIGLHLGGNWVQASLFSFQPAGHDVPRALWTAYVTDVQQHLLTAPDLDVHVPFIATMLAAILATHFAFPKQRHSA